MDPELRHNEDASRYEMVIDDDVVAIADYRLFADVTVFPHTEVQPHLRGRGLGEQLVRFALDDQRRAERRIEPRCWFVAQFIDDNPEYADLLRTG
jgi:predicted GNAT family acetyltransferase